MREVPLEPDPLIGRALGSYRVIRRIGEGGMGGVYVAEHPAIGSKVAIKVLHARLAADRSIVDRFFNEARAVNLIGHDNIVKILDFNVTDDGRHYFVMEFLEGRPLQSHLAGGQPLPLRLVAPVILQCCRALHAAHQHNIVHRDLKPDNIFLTTHGGLAYFVKIVDFGIAKLSDLIGGARTQTGTVMGTPAYMSPEQAAGETTTIGPASDIYSLGVVLFQLLVGRPPFADSSASLRRVMLAHLRDPPPLPRSINPKVPSRLEALVLKALEKEPENRFASMREMHDALLACFEKLKVRCDLPRTDEVESDIEGERGDASLPTVTPAASRTRDSLEDELPTVTRQPRIMGRTFFGAAAVAVVAGAGAFLWLRPFKAKEAKPPPPPAVVDLVPAAAPAPPPTTIATPVAPVEKPEHDQPPPAPPPVAKTKAASKKVLPQVKAIPAVEVPLFVASDPPASVEASWPGGGQHGETPIQIRVPKDSTVKLVFTRAGYKPETRELSVAQAQAVTAALAPEK